MKLPPGWALKSRPVQHFSLGKLTQIVVYNKQKHKKMTFTGDPNERKQIFQAAVKWANEMEEES